MKVVEFKIDKLPDFSNDQIECVYKGKPDTCMCGCSGNYFYTTKNREIAGLKRGYAIEIKEVDDNKVNQIANIFRHASYIENLNNQIFTIIRNESQYTLYFLEPLKDKVIF